jgi:4-alpha-glucanotransferase
MTDLDSTTLRRLAERVGILSEYLDQTGRETRQTSDETRRALLDAMRVESEDQLDTEDAEHLLAPVQCRSERSEGPGQGLSGQWEVEIRLESGETLHRHGRDYLDLGDLPLGYHDVSVSADGKTEHQLLIVVPDRCVTPAEKSFGLTTNLYTIRSSRNWGIGDFNDLATLASWGGENGADFVGVNPLHTLMNRGTEISPYSPVSRLFRNPIYIDVENVPELSHAPDIHRRINAPELAAELEALRESPSVKYDQVAAVKGIALDALFRVFDEQVHRSGDRRARDYDAFVQRSGETLHRFATWMTIAEREGSDWRRWPAQLQEADSDEVRHFAAAHASRVRFHCWLQFEADRQLAEAARAGSSAGMRIGLYQDLAVGSAPNGADTWAFPDLFARGVNVGAPPDPYAPQGQDWGLPPIDPRALRRGRYRYFIELVRRAFAHSGALRIDHVLGLFRLFWIPQGKSGDHGAYVRYPTEDLLGILALESVRNDAIVVGEDLGTVPPEVAPMLEKWGVLSSKVMFFEREWDGRFKSAASYPSLALATADTHDMAPIAGFWAGRDVEVRRTVGLIDEREAQEQLNARDNDRNALLDRLAEETTLPRGESHSLAEVIGGVHGFMGRAPSVLVGLALDDIALEKEPVNVPGVGPDRFPSWTRKMREPLEQIMSSAETQVTLRCDGRRSARGG